MNIKSLARRLKLNHNTLGLMVAIACSILFGVHLLSLNIYAGSTRQVPLTSLDIMMMGLCGFALAVLAFRVFRLRALYLACFFLGVLYLMIVPYYSPIDEGAHFDIINHIIQYHSYPTIFQKIDAVKLSLITNYSIPGGTPQYEAAVQPPLYYFLGAIVGGGFHDLLLRFVVLRLMGISFLALILHFIIMSYKSLLNRNYIKENDFLIYSLVFIFFFTPGMLTRVVTLSNEGLMILAASILFYWMIEHIDLDTLTLKNMIVLILTLGCVINSKLSGAYLFGIVLFYLIIIFGKRGLYCFLVVSLSTILLLSPWLIFNMKYYGHMTGMIQHIAFVRPIVNPQNISLGWDYILNNLSVMYNTFFIPQETVGAISPVVQIIINLLTVTVVMGLMIQLIEKIRRISQRQLNNVDILEMLLLVSIVFNVASLLYATYHYSVGVMLGRYLYMNIIALIVLSFNALTTKLHRKHLQKISVILLIISMVLLITQTTQFLKMGQRNLAFVLVNGQTTSSIPRDSNLLRFNASLEISEAGGWIDSIQPENVSKNEIIIATGWAINPLSNSIPKGVLVVVNSEPWPYLIPLSLDRQDVVKAVGSQNVLHSGWSVKLKGDQLKSGINRLQFYAVLKDGRYAPLLFGQSCPNKIYRTD